MARYYFNLDGTRGIIPDPDGMELADEGSARNHAVVVAQELMRNQEFQTRHWCLVVTDSERVKCFTLSFASIDRSLDHLPPALRQAYEGLTQAKTELNVAIQDVRLSIHQVKATLARADKAPYLAAISGVRI